MVSLSTIAVRKLKQRLEETFPHIHALKLSAYTYQVLRSISKNEKAAFQPLKAFSLKSNPLPFQRALKQALEYLHW